LTFAGKTERDASVQDGKAVSLDEGGERERGLRVQLGGPSVRVAEAAVAKVRGRRVQGRSAPNGLRRRPRSGSRVHQQLGGQPDQRSDQGPDTHVDDIVRHEARAGKQRR